MALQPGTRIGPYEVSSSLGSGGMGEVYRARDSKLKRDVAIKVLPADVAGDRERLARFQREAEVLAALNHPNIAHLYGIEDSALVMELVEGEDLSQRIARGPIPIDEALPIARQIAEALEAAHELGIIHRDLKPANIKVRDDGTVKVLDFGLAKALDAGVAGTPGAVGATNLANSPTITSPAMTVRGMILGTAAYMSPEQAKGRLVDKRADIWAFGCVLYEMLVGKKAFAGEDVTDTITAVMRDQPDWTALPPETPEAVRRLLRRCLQKDARQRMRDAGDARLELADHAIRERVRALPTSSGWHLPAAIGVLVGAAGVAIVALVGRSGPGVESGRPPVRFTIVAPEGSVFPGAGSVPRFALSPDGRWIAYQLQDAKSVRLFVRSLAAIDAEPTASQEPAEGTAGSVPGGNTQQPFWSPDSQLIAFFDAEAAQMKKYDPRTRLTDVITAVPGNQVSGSWSAADTIVFSSLLTGGIRQVRPNGEGARQLTAVDASKKEAAHLWPEFLGDGRHFTYLVTFEDGTPAALYVSSIDGGTPKRLFDSPTGARFAWPDRLLFVRNEALVSQPFDLGTLSTTGQPEVIAAGVLFTPAGRIGVATATRAPVIAYAAASGTGLGEGFETQWVDRAGNTASGSPSSVVTGFTGIRLTPDGRTLLYTRGVLRNRADVTTNLWAQDTQRGIETRVTDSSTTGAQAAASPDGTRLVYRLFGTGRVSLMLLPLSSSTEPVRLFTGEDGDGVIPFDWTPRDEVLFFVGARRPDRTGLWLLPLAGDRRPTRYLPGEYRFGASLSTDGQWIAYAEGETVATAQVFVQSFHEPALGKWPVSAIGGGFPRWRGDGRELFYLDGRRRLMAVPIATSPRVVIGSPSGLFDVVGVDRSAAAAYPYDVMPDGKRFVVVRPRASAREIVYLVVDVR